ncbi:MAG: xylulokinase [Amylibacter sp.]
MTDSHTTFLGLDLGTSGLRALLVDVDGTPIASAQAHYESKNPQTGWSEQDPSCWIEACKQVLAKLIEKYSKEMSKLAAIATSGHMHGATLLDKDGHVLRPCILWNDTRSHLEASKLDSDPIFREKSGNIVFPGFTAPKLAWVQTNEPDIFAKTTTVLLPKDYLTYWLTGRLVSEMSDAAGTSWLDVENRDWSPELVTKSGMQMDQMPSLFEGTDVVGLILSDRASELQLNPTVKIVAGAADNAAAACGIGALTDGQGFVSLGTSGVLLAGQSTCSPSPETAVHTFCHAIPNTWYQMGVILSATDSLNWLSRIVRKTPSALAELMPDTLQKPTSLIFVPYLSGERTPHNDSAVRGAFIGLDIGTDHTQIVQAIFEGVAFALRDNLEALASTGTSLNDAFATGGGAQSEYWLNVLATTLGLKLKVPEGQEFGAALGAARLAICGATDRPVADVMPPPKTAKIIHPDTNLKPDFDAAYEKYKAVYPALKRLNQ